MTKDQTERKIKQIKKIMIAGIMLIIISIALLSTDTTPKNHWINGILFGLMFGVVGAILFVKNLSQLIKFHLK